MKVKRSGFRIGIVVMNFSTAPALKCCGRRSLVRSKRASPTFDAFGGARVAATSAAVTVSIFTGVVMFWSLCGPWSVHRVPLRRSANAGVLVKRVLVIVLRYVDTNQPTYTTLSGSPEVAFVMVGCQERRGIDY